MTLTPFTNGEFALPVIIDGDTFRVPAPELARALGFRQALDMTRSLDDDEKGYELVRTPGGEQRVGYVTEAGFYRVLGQRQAARVGDADTRARVERFQTWVYSEVLPAIRKHGGYLTPEAIEKTLTDPDFIIRLATDLKAERAKRAELETVVTEQRAHLQLVEPKAAAFDRWLSANVDYSVDQVAKALAATGARLPDGRTVGRNLLLAWMGTPTTEGGPGWVFRNARHQWTPYQQHGPAGAKRLTVKLGRYEDAKTGAEHGTVTVRITPKGAADLAHLLGVLPEPVAQHLEGASDAVA